MLFRVFETTQGERAIVSCWILNKNYKFKETIFEQAGAIAPPSTSKHFGVDCIWYRTEHHVAALVLI
jgi:hypothetical protein